MPRKQHDIHVRPAARYFNYCCAVAHLKIDADDLPGWFREHFDRGQHIEQEYALPPKVLVIFALALDLSFTMTTAELKRFKEKHKDGRDRLKKCRTDLLALRDHSLMPLGPDPTDEIIQAIDTYVEQLSAVKIGRKTSAVHCAVRKVDSYVDKHNAGLSQKQRNDLRHYLFDEIRRRHGQRSCSKSCDAEETPRYRDLFSKRSTRPRRKISKKAC